MKYASKLFWVCVWIAAGILSFHLLGVESFAAEEGSNWRPTYDLIMRWVNFFIIVFLVYKYARVPFMNFLRGRKEKIEKEIQSLEEEKQNTAAKIKETQQFVEESDVRFADLKARIVQQGERQKEAIIQLAQQQSRNMLEDANRRIQSYVLEARNALKAELIDAAIDLAMQKLPQVITDADNQKFLEEYLVGTQAQ